jgi:hypothetical protein
MLAYNISANEEETSRVRPRRIERWRVIRKDTRSDSADISADICITASCTGRFLLSCHTLYTYEQATACFLFSHKKE